MVRNFRKNASLKERFFGNFILLSGKLPVVPGSNLLMSEDRDMAEERLMVGDLVFVGSTQEISRFFVRGVFSHVLIYVGKNKLIHSNLKHGVTEVGLEELFLKYDFLTVYRQQGISSTQVRKVVEFARKSLGTAYDFRFLPENDKELYCTKLVYLAYEKAGIELRSSLTSNCLSYFSITHPSDFVLHDFRQVFASKSLDDLRVMQAKKWPGRWWMRIMRLFMRWDQV